MKYSHSTPSHCSSRLHTVTNEYIYTPTILIFGSRVNYMHKECLNITHTQRLATTTVNRYCRIIKVIPHNISVSAYTEMPVCVMQLTAILHHVTPPTKYTFTNAFVSYSSYTIPPSRPYSRVPFNTNRRLSKLLHYLLHSMHADILSDISLHHSYLLTYSMVQSPS